MWYLSAFPVVFLATNGIFISMNVQTKMVMRSLLAILALGSSAGCAYRVSLPPEDHGFIGYEYSNRSMVIAAEPFLSPALNQSVFKVDLPAGGILPIRLAITNLGPNVLAPSGLPQLRDASESVWPLIPAREVAKQVRQSAVMNGLMARAPFLGLLAAPLGLILTPLVGGAADFVASHNTTTANDDMTDDLVELGYRPLTIAPGATYRAFVFFRVPPPARTVTDIPLLTLTLSIEDVTVRRTLQGTITIRAPILYTRGTIWDRPSMRSLRQAKSSPSAKAGVVLAGLQAPPASIDAETRYRQAVEAAEIGQWDTALDALGQTVQANGAHQGALVGRGVLRARQGHIKDAAADLTQAIDLGLRSADTHTYRGVLWARQGEAALAVQDWTTASLLSPNFPLPRYNRGMLSWMQGEPEKATADFEAACNLGFAPACLSLLDLETRSPCCPPGVPVRTPHPTPALPVSPAP
jgi:hypothetical protein